MFWSKEDHARAFARLDEIDAAARLYVKQLLDEYHGKERPQRYYDILTGYWLQVLMHATLVALEPPGDAAVPVTSPPDIATIPTDGALTDHIVQDVGFHAKLRALIEGTSGETPRWSQPTAVIGGVADGFRGSLRQLLKRCMASIGRSDGVLVCAPYAKCSPLQWLGFVMRARRVMRWHDLDAMPAHRVAIDQIWRVKKFRAIKPTHVSLLDAVRRLVPLLLPVAYLEGFGELRRAALKMPVGTPRAFYTANALYHNVLFKLLAAEHQEASLLLGHQHGGSYGMDLRHAPEEYERAVCDFFYTWGWHGGAETRALSPPAFLRRDRTRQWNLMLCLADFPQTRYRVQYFPIAEEAQRTVRDTVDFARGVADTGTQRVFIRLPPNDFGGKWFGELHAALPDAHRDRFEKKAIERFAESRLVFHNCMSTAWLESVWLDVPTLALCDPDICAFRGAAEPFATKFAKYGLLQPSGVAAARFYASIRTDVEAWWSEPGFRAARAEFIAQYVKVSPDWQSEWLREFTWLLENRPQILARRNSLRRAPGVSQPLGTAVSLS